MKRIAALALAFTLLFQGCFSYRDMNRLLFFTTGVFDVVDNDLFFYAEFLKAYRGEGEKAGSERRIVSYGKGSTVAEAADQVRRATNYPHEYAGGKAAIFTKAFAKNGVYSLFDFYQRDQKPSLRQYIFVLDGKPSEILDMSLEEEQFLGLYLYEMLNTTRHSIGIISTQAYQFLQNMNTGSKVNVVPLIKIRKYEEEQDKPKDDNVPDKEKSSEPQGGEQQGKAQQGGQQGETLQNNEHIITDGAAVFVSDKMQATLNTTETNVFNLLYEPVMGGLLESPNPEHPETMIGYSILKSKTKRRIELVDSRIKLNYTVNLRVILLDSKMTLSSDHKDVQEAIKQSLANRLRNDSLALFDRMKADGIDILNVKKDSDIRFGMEKIENPLEITDFDVRFNITLDGTGKVKNGLY